jgi:hypothetical protein
MEGPSLGYLFVTEWRQRDTQAHLCCCQKSGLHSILAEERMLSALGSAAVQQVGQRTCWLWSRNWVSPTSQSFSHRQWTSLACLFFLCIFVLWATGLSCITTWAVRHQPRNLNISSSLKSWALYTACWFLPTYQDPFIVACGIIPRAFNCTLIGKIESMSSFFH